MRRHLASLYVVFYLIMGKKREGGKEDEGMEDWVAALARKEAVGSSSKNERIEKRLSKKRRREERKLHAHPAKKIQQKDVDRAVSLPPLRQPTKTAFPERFASSQQLMLDSLAQKVKLRVSVSRTTKSWQKPYSAVFKSKKKRKRDDSIQPRNSDYGGIGLARPSMYIAFDDPSWQPKLEEEFAEHIPGFFGKQRTKAMKKQLDGNMLWRQLRASKKAVKTPSSKRERKINGKKLSELSPDERVEAMIQAGMI